MWHGIMFGSRKLHENGFLILIVVQFSRLNDFFLLLFFNVTLLMLCEELVKMIQAGTTAVVKRVRSIFDK